MRKRDLVERLEAIEEHVYGPVGDDIEQLHQCVDMWSDPCLKDRVSTLEEAFDLLVQVLSKEQVKRVLTILTNSLEVEARGANE